MITRFRKALLLSVLPLAVAVGAVAHATSVPSAPELAVPAVVPAEDLDDVHYVSPTGTGTSCSRTAPCGTLVAALRHAGDGGQVHLLAGRYRGVPDGRGSNGREAVMDRRLAARLKDMQEGVTVRPAPGADVTFERDIEVYVPNITWDGMRLHNAWMAFNTGADGNRFLNGTIDGERKSKHLRFNANDIEVAYSTITGNKNGSEIGGGLQPSDQGRVKRNLWIHNNVIGGATVDDGQSHIDCIHIWGGFRGITIENNYIYGCTHKGILLQNRHGDMRDVRVENNVLVACAGDAAQCGGDRHYLALHIGLTGSPKYAFDGVTIQNNTLADGPTGVRADLYVGPGESRPTRFTVSGNIIGELYRGREACAAWLTDNIIGTTGCRRTLDISNRVGAPTYVDPSASDYRLTLGSLGVDHGVRSAPADDKRGVARDVRPDAGAYENTTEDLRDEVLPFAARGLS